MMIRKPHLLSWLIPLSTIFLIVPFVSAAQNQPATVHWAAGQQQTETDSDAYEEPEADAPSGVGFSVLGRNIRLNGLAEFNAEYLDVADLEDPRREDSSDFFISSLELATRVFFNDWSKLKLVVSAEDFGKNGEEGRVIMSEAIATLEAPWVPLYLIVGRTEIPFGVFEDRLIEGTLTEEVYEIDDVGLIFGFAPDLYGLDLSVAVYEEPTIIDNLEEFDVFEKAEGRSQDDRFDSYVANLTAEPFEDTLYLSVFYDNEPGDGRRNQSIGSAIGVSLWRLSVDAEWISALTREAGENEVENKESAWTAGAALELTEAVELAGRYERFDDDDSGAQDEVLDYRWVAGGNYQFGEWTTLSLEYRCSKFEKEPDSDIEDQQHMVQLQLTFAY
jgi:hypothetical protein